MAASIIATVDQPPVHEPSAGGESPRVEISEEAALGVHRDAISLKRSEFFKAAVISAGSIAVAVTGILWNGVGRRISYFPILLLLFAARFIVSTVTLGLEWRRLVRETPIGSLERERREDAEVAAHRARMRVVKWPPATMTLLSAVALVTLVEFVVMAMRGDALVVRSAALVKPAVTSGEWWRLLSAAFLHAGGMHLAGNLTTLGALGSLIEAYDRPLRVPLVFLIAAVVGNVASTIFLSATSLGASGGILGLAGYALVIAIRRSSGPSGWLLNQLIRLIGVVLVMGVIGFFFIDNAGHIGGLVAGIALGMLAVPRAGASLSAERARWLDTSGSIATAVLVIAAVGTIIRLLTI